VSHWGPASAERIELSMLLFEQLSPLQIILL
jgi:hypothetical protein